MKNIDLESERLIFNRLSAKHVSANYLNWINDPEVNMYLEIRSNYTMDLLKTYIEEQYKNEVYFLGYSHKRDKQTYW